MRENSFRARITKTIINRLKPGDVVWDTELKGFGARRQKDSISYIMKTRVEGKQKWFTIGKHGLPWTPDSARKEALSLKVDPTKQRNKQKAKKKLGEVLEHFKREHLDKLKPSTKRDYLQVIDKYIRPKLSERFIIDINRSDMAELHSSLKKTPRTANKVLAILSKLMSWAEAFEYRLPKSNPCTGIKKYSENKRERYLSEEELGRLGKNLSNAESEGEISVYAAAALRLLILTGARLGEILNLKWDYVDFGRRKLFLPDSKTGQKAISLNDPAILVLTSLLRLEGNPYVIVGRVSGQPIVNLQKPWSYVRDKAGLKDIRLHDLRHSYASVAASSGASLPMIGKLLGHTQTQTTARYAHLADDPVTELNEQVGDIINNAMTGIENSQ